MFALNPMFAGATSQGDEVGGMTVLQEELFLVRHLATDVEFYDGVTLNLQRRLAVDRLDWPADMASSVKYGCLYIAGRRHVYRLELDDGATTRWPLKRICTVSPRRRTVPTSSSRTVP